MTLEVQNLHVRTEDREILHGVDLVVKRGETHALMGPNGSGKSTLANTLMGNPNYEVTEGRILLNGEDLTEADPDERARAGLFMAFQYPATIPGVSVANFLRMAMNAGREEPIKVKEFGALLGKNMELLKIDRAFTSRYLNEGFSGGEKKRAEILQLAMLQPEFAVLDETDSGLDIDALRIVAEGVNAMRGAERGFLIITHYTRILEYVKPDFVHILLDGRIVREGGSELADELEDKGYEFVREGVAASGAWFVEDRRRAALEVYESQDVPTWRRSGFWTTSLRGLDLDALEPRRYDSLDSALVRDHLGDEEHAALIVQQGANIVHCDVADERIIVMPLEEAVEKHADLVEEWFGKRLPYDEGKFPAGTAAFWTGGVFVYVPDNVRIEKPIQAVWLIEEPGTVQWAHSLVVVGENAECKVREYFLAPDFEGQALHAGAFELYARPGAQVHLAHYQDWGSGEVHDLSVRRVEVQRDAHVKWVPIHLGGHLTKQTLDIITAEPGSDMRHTGMYFTERDEHLDLFTTDKHEAGHTTGDTVWKGALTGESRASYEGLIHIVPKAPEVDTYLQTHQMLLSPKAKGDAIPSLIVEVDNVKASHGGTVGELDPEQIFYMMTRGIPRAEAVRVLVEGYFEEVVMRLDDPGLEELVRRRISEKLADAEDQVREFIGERAEAS